MADTIAMLCAIASVDPARPHHLLEAACVGLPVVVILNHAGGLYRVRFALSALDDLPALAVRAGVAVAVSLTAARWLHLHWLTALAAHSRSLAALIVCQILVDFLGRSAVFAVARGIRRRHPRHTLIAGAGHVGQRVTAALLDHPEYGLRPVGYIDSDPIFLPSDSSVPVLGGPATLDLHIPAQRVRAVVLVSGTTDDSEWTQTLRTSTRHGCEVWLVPGVPEFSAFASGSQLAAQGDHLWGFPCLRLAQAATDRPTWVLKRGIDIVLATLGLVLSAPLLATCALAVRIDGGPGVIFRQQRVGLLGTTFDVLKFRTLRPADDRESNTLWNISHDHRMSRIGRFLRSSSLDEVPQLWNVLRGDMSLVGPRPERPYFVTRFTQAYPRYGDRHRVPVGITGLAQVNGLRGDTSIEDRTRFDNHYIESWSLWQDIKIMLRTVSSVFRSSGS
ncbi:sugar transferase [Streptacidiphilus sp. EB129]|uniref:sugar transferase n=1 Tax=Streptacidiphilus sp. EB129 TaxID=3156262 RepID=UPI00351899B7